MGKWRRLLAIGDGRGLSAMRCTQIQTRSISLVTASSIRKEEFRQPLHLGAADYLAEGGGRGVCGRSCGHGTLSVGKAGLLVFLHKRQGFLNEYMLVRKFHLNIGLSHYQGCLKMLQIVTQFIIL